MKLRRQYSRQILFVTGLLLIVMAIVASRGPYALAESAQSCSQIAKGVQDQLATNCKTVGANQVCYGHSLVTAEFVDPAAQNPAFAQAGDMVALEKIALISPSALNPQQGVWGVAVLRVLGGELVGTADQMTTFILYGDTDLTRQQPEKGSIATPVPKACSGQTAASTSLRKLPNPTADPVQALELGTTVQIGAINPDSSWVWALAEGKAGWIPLRDLNLSCNLRTLPVNNPDAAASLLNLDNFQFTTGSKGAAAVSACPSLPAGGMYAQVPPGQPVSFKINGVDVKTGNSGLVTSLLFDVRMQGTTLNTALPKQALTGSEDTTARLWDTSTGQPIRTFSGHTGAVYGVAFSPDGKQVLTGSADTTARLWDAATGKTIRTFSGNAGIVYSVAFSPDGKQVLTGNADMTAQLWDAATGKMIRAFSGHSGAVYSVAFSPDGKQVLTGADDWTARLWDTSSGETIRTFSGHKGALRSVSFSLSGRYVLTGSEDKSAQLWDARTGDSVQVFNSPTGPVYGAALSPNGHYVLTDGVDTSVRLWTTGTRQTVRTFSGHTGAVRSVSFSSNALYALTGSEDNTARIWDVSTGQSLRTLSGHTGRVDSVAFPLPARSAPTQRVEEATCIGQLAGTDTPSLLMFVYAIKGQALISVQGVTITLLPNTMTTIPVCYTPTGLVPINQPDPARPGTPPSICDFARAVGLDCSNLPTPVVKRYVTPVPTFSGSCSERTFLPNGTVCIPNHGIFPCARNGYCGPGESMFTCPEDCGTPPPPIQGPPAKGPTACPVNVSC